MGLFSDALAQAVIPLAALVGIGFALFQWLLVSRIKVSNENGYSESLIENEEEGVDDFDAVVKCSDIQSAISVGQLLSRHYKVVCLVCSDAVGCYDHVMCSNPFFADERALIILSIDGSVSDSLTEYSEASSFFFVFFRFVLLFGGKNWKFNG